MKTAFIKVPVLFKSEMDDKFANLGIEIADPKQDIMDAYLSVHDITAFHENHKGTVNVYLGADMWTVCMEIKEFKNLLEIEI